MVQCIHFMETEVTESTKHGQRGEGGRMCLVMRVIQRCVANVTNLPFDPGGVGLPNSGELVASQDQWKCTEQQSQIAHALFTVVRALVLVVGDDAIDDLAQKALRPNACPSTILSGAGFQCLRGLGGGRLYLY